MKPHLLALSLTLCAGCQALVPNRDGPPAVGEEQSGAQAPSAADGLQRAAECVEKGDDAGAVPHLLRHIQGHPEQVMIRAYLAELLLRLDRDAEAQAHFERFIVDAQDVTGPANKHLVHCHTRLMEIAQDREDAYAEKLHRGVGLYLLARQQAALPDAGGKGMTQELLCKAVKELDEARKLRPGEARPCVYQFLAWSMLDQRRPAERALRQGRESAPFCDLTPSERRSLLAGGVTDLAVR